MSFIPVPAGIIASEKYWLSELTRRLMLRDFDSVSGPVDTEIGDLTGLVAYNDGGTGVIWGPQTDIPALYLQFPTGAGIDDDRNIGETETEFRFNFQARRTPSGNDTEIRLVLVSGDAVVKQTATATIDNTSLTRYEVALIFFGMPTGWIELTWETRGSAQQPANFDFHKRFGDNYESRIISRDVFAGSFFIQPSP